MQRRTVAAPSGSDRIGREGVVFTEAFCINSLCLPARATILSGLYSHTTGAVDNQHSKVPDRFPIDYFGFSGQADYQCPVVVEGADVTR